MFREEFRLKNCRIMQHTIVVIGIWLLLVPSGFAMEQCLKCHGDSSLAKVDSLGQQISLYLDETIHKRSLHGYLGCRSCHVDVKDEEHMVKPQMVDCGRCHPEEWKLYQQGVHGQKFQEGDKNAPACQDCHTYHDIRKSDDPEADTYRLNLPEMCAKCHTLVQEVRRYRAPVHEAPYLAYEKSIHGKAIKEKGLIKAAVCSDCHESHDLKRHSDPSSLIYRTHIPRTCGTCHFGAYNDYMLGIHGQYMAKGVTDAPVCTDCHREHDIEAPEEKTSSIYGATVSKVTCPRCHSAEYLSEGYGIVSQRKTTRLDTYHGVASEAGITKVADCASCHGYHEILPSTDPKSSINKNNLEKTCGKCHPNAGVNFTKGSMHLAPSPQRDVVIFYVIRFYISLIVVTIGGMIVHNSLIMLRHLREKYRQTKSEGIVVRFTSDEVVRHFLLFISFTILVITGFALRYPDAWWARWLAESEGGFRIRSFLHRAMGVLFTGLFIYNWLYSFLTERGKEEIIAKLPVLSDIKHVIQNMRYFLGLSNEKPKFDKFNYTEKAEYWAMAWGGMVMIVTGLPMWFENYFMQYMPKWLVDVFKTVHFYEAWLATLAILVWHMFFMIFDPETYPINWSWITGKISAREMKERHPLEWERMVKRGEVAEEDAEEEW